MSRCPKYYEMKLSDGGGNVTVRPRYCQKWTCRRCGEWKAYQAAVSLATTASLLVDNAHGREPMVRFLSCTFAQKRVDRETAWAEIGDAVQKFCHRLKYQKSSGVLAYAWVIGKHKNGYPHAHVMTVGGQFLPVSHLRAMWAKGSDFGGSVRPTRVRSGMAACRYFAGNAAGKLDEQVDRRIGCTQNLSLGRKRRQGSPRKDDWVPVGADADGIARELSSAGYAVARQSNGVISAARVLASPAPPVLLGVPLGNQCAETHTQSSAP